jgi:AraC-like DNA-binding protein
LLERPARFAARLRKGIAQQMDVLSEVLKAVRLDGAFFYNGEFSAPWAFRTPASAAAAPYFAPASGHLIIYHLLTEGHGWAGVEGGEQIPLEAGDIVIFPHGHSHILRNGPPVEPIDNEQNLESVRAQGLKLARGGGGGEVSKFVCGFMGCDPDLSRMVLAGLPPVLKVGIRDGAAGHWLESSIRFAVDAAGSDQAGGAAVLGKLSELLFIEALRRYVNGLPAEQTGWLAGARDPDVGKALALLHANPAQPWTIAGLAAQVGVSRSVLAERFRHFLGEPPMSYLTRWRLQAGARLLKSTSRSVADVAAEVGYESEAAFNRAFKREFNLPPARFRNESRAGGSKRATNSESATRARQA